MPTKDAVLVPNTFDRSTLPPHMGIRDCVVCETAFFYGKTLSRSGKEKKFCSIKCSDTAKSIRAYQRRNGYPANIEAFIRNPADFPRLNPLSNKKIAEITITKPKHKPPPISVISKYFDECKTGHQRAYLGEPPSEETIALNKAMAEKERARAETAKAQAATAKTKLKEQEAEAASRDHIRSQSEAIIDARKSLGLLSLSERKDVLSGRRAFLPEEDIAKARASINVIVENNLVIAEKVLDGSVQWSPTQVSIFRALLNKVVPDAAASKPVSPKSKSLAELTIEELEEMVASAKQPKVVNE